jgi:hypothetical protein
MAGDLQDGCTTLLQPYSLRRQCFSILAGSLYEITGHQSINHMLHAAGMALRQGTHALDCLSLQHPDETCCSRRFLKQNIFHVPGLFLFGDHLAVSALV